MKKTFVALGGAILWVGCLLMMITIANGRMHDSSMKVTASATTAPVTFGIVQTLNRGATANVQVNLYTDVAIIDNDPAATLASPLVCIGHVTRSTFANRLAGQANYSDDSPVRNDQRRRPPGATLQL